MKRFFIGFMILLISTQLFAFPNRRRMESRVGTISRELTEAVFENPKENLQELVSTLTSSANNDYTKVKLIHDWICNNIEYDTEMWFSGKSKRQDYGSVLTKKKAVCAGYASLFNKMCELAGIESIGIKGYSKGFGYNGKMPEKPNHEWNAVRIGLQWHLIDCCWDAGYVDYKTFIKQYSDQWFMLPPEQFIYSHLPEDEENQFLDMDNIRSQEDFVKEPFIKGKFFQYGFNLTDRYPFYTNEINGPVTYTFKVTNQNITTTVGLQNNINGARVNNLAWIERRGNNYNFEFDVPDSGNYKGYIFAKENNIINYPDRFSVYEFETKILPGAAALVAKNPEPAKSISQEEYEIFLDAFEKVEENSAYYYKENQFYTKQQNIIKVIFNLLKVQNSYLEPILDFDIKAADNYPGYGPGKKYPETYNEYNATTNTHLISPKQAALKAGETYKIKIFSTNYKNFAVLENGELVTFKKNLGTGLFETDFTVPANEKKIVILGSTNGKNFSGLIKYDVEK